MNLNPVGWASSSLRLVARLFNSGVNSSVPVTAISEAPVGYVDADIALIAKGAGATLAQVPDGTTVGGTKRGQYATDLQKLRTGIAQTASGNQSVIAGGRSNTASAIFAVVTGGDNNTASSNYSFVGGGQTNTAQTNTHATVCGGSSNMASGQYSFAGGGTSNTASGQYSCVAGGANNTADQLMATVVGGRYGTTRSIIGYTVFPATNAAIAAAAGVVQSALLCLAKATTDATATVLTSNGGAASTINQVILPNNAAYSFSGEVIAGVTGGGDTARWTINGAIKRGATAASTAMVGTPTVTMTHNDAGAAAWVVAVTADTTNGGIAVTVTGAAATTIRWVCKINTTEVTY